MPHTTKYALIHYIIQEPYEDPETGILCMDVYVEASDGFGDITLVGEDLNSFWPIIKHTKSPTLEPYKLEI